MAFDQIADKEIVTKTVEALAQNGITAEVVATAEDAKHKVEDLIPEGAEVMTMTSVTLQESGITDLLDESGHYDSVKHKLSQMNRETDGKQMQQLGAAPEWAVGSVHAVTQSGQVIVVSNTGSQLPAYVYGSQHLIWVVGTQKIVKDYEEGIQRINEYIVPKETIRARKAYGLDETFHTFPSKILTFNRETQPDRIHLIFVEEVVGF